jgi:hypothetical protein
MFYVPMSLYTLTIVVCYGNARTAGTTTMHVQNNCLVNAVQQRASFLLL